MEKLNNLPMVNHKAYPFGKTALLQFEPVRREFISQGDRICLK